MSYMAQMQSLPLEAKIVKTKQRIKEWYEYFDGNVYVSFSGGKDSTVLLHLVREMYPEVEAVFVDTGLEWPESKEFVRNTPGVTWLKPDISFRETINKYGYPVINKDQAAKIGHVQRRKREGTWDKTADRFMGYKGKSGSIAKRWRHLVDAPYKISAKCCATMKINPIRRFESRNPKLPFIGTRASESKLRFSSMKNRSCNLYVAARPSSYPLSFWLEQDILQYIKEENIKIAEIYGKVRKMHLGNEIKYKTTIEPRTGCMFCLFGIHREEPPNKIQRMKDLHPKLWKYCIEDLGLKQVMEHLKISYN